MQLQITAECSQLPRICSNTMRGSRGERNTHKTLTIRKSAGGAGSRERLPVGKFNNMAVSLLVWYITGIHYRKIFIHPAFYQHRLNETVIKMYVQESIYTYISTSGPGHTQKIIQSIRTSSSTINIYLFSLNKFNFDNHAWQAND